MRKFSLLLALCAGFSIAQTAVELESAPVNRVARKLACTCGCAQDMSCQMEPGCGICKRAKTKIFAMQQAGKSDPQILDQFVAENGRTILNITPGLYGTAGPFVALSIGAIFVVVMIRKYRKPAAPQGAHEVDPAILDRIDKDLAKLD